MLLSPIPTGVLLTLAGLTHTHRSAPHTYAALTHTLRRPRDTYPGPTHTLRSARDTYARLTLTLTFYNRSQIVLCFR